MTFDDAPDLLTVREVATLTRWGRNQVYEAIRRGEFPHVRLGRSIRVPKGELLRFLTAVASGVTSDRTPSDD